MGYTKTKTYKNRDTANRAADKVNAESKNGGKVKAVQLTADIAEDGGFDPKLIGEWVLVLETEEQVPSSVADRIDDDVENLIQRINEQQAAGESADNEPVIKETGPPTVEEAADQKPEAVEQDPQPEPQLTDEERTELEKRRAALKEELGEVEAKLATRQSHDLMTSAIPKPVSVCRDIFIEMYLASKKEGAPEFRRRDVVNRLVDMGVAPNTAKTQYGILLQKLKANELDLDEGENGEE